MEVLNPDIESGTEVCLYNLKGRIKHVRIYKCLICQERLANKEALAEHKLTHSDHKPFECPHCVYKCTLKDILRNHIEIQHGFKVKRNDIFPFKKYEAIFPFKKYEAMITEYKCTICKQQFDSKRTLHEHFRITPTCQKYSCPHCENRSKNLIITRTFSHHPDMSERYEKKSISSRMNRSARKRMRILKDEPISEEENENIEGDGPISMSDARKITIYRCTTCSRQFHSKSTLYRHNLSHIGSKPFGCPQCDYRSTLRGIMKNHLEIRHGISMKITDIAPDKKDKMFIRAYMCTTCNKVMSSKESLQKHMMTNKTCKPFRCMFCDYRSSLKSTMKRHIQGKHKRTVSSTNIIPVTSCNGENSQTDDDDEAGVKMDIESSEIIPGVSIKEEVIDYEEEFEIKLEQPKIEVKTESSPPRGIEDIRIKLEFEDSNDTMQEYKYINLFASVRDIRIKLEFEDSNDTMQEYKYITNEVIDIKKEEDVTLLSQEDIKIE
ncbi:Zinc finger, C2H2 type [Popillia japonica]|uniref:Zinc finger, C2H2 type n=1 Tax=Popillia japonica TaxID=7064 RepID=A0AAW1N6H1_POPJA